MKQKLFVVALIVMIRTLCGVLWIYIKVENLFRGNHARSKVIRRGKAQALPVRRLAHSSFDIKRPGVSLSSLPRQGADQNSA